MGRIYVIDEICSEYGLYVYPLYIFRDLGMGKLSEPRGSFSLCRKSGSRQKYLEGGEPKKNSGDGVRVVNVRHCWRSEPRRSSQTREIPMVKGPTSKGRLLPMDREKRYEIFASDRSRTVLSCVFHARVFRPTLAIRTLQVRSSPATLRRIVQTRRKRRGEGCAGNPRG